MSCSLLSKLIGVVRSDVGTVPHSESFLYSKILLETPEELHQIRACRAFEDGKMFEPEAGFKNSPADSAVEFLRMPYG
jgi:hypothetical protein